MLFFLSACQICEMDSTLQTKYQILLSQLDSSAPYRPLDAFSLNTSLGVTVSGLILTYTVVLLQFWISETASTPMFKPPANG